MPGILVGETWIECRLVLFEMDGTPVDKKFRSRSLARVRHEHVSRLAEDAASSDVAELEGVLLRLYRDGEEAEARQLMDALMDERLMEGYGWAVETVSGFMGGEEPEAAENEDKTLVYLGVAGVMLLIGGVLVAYIMKVGPDIELTCQELKFRGFTVPV